jgi:putative tryptophan/tyrosine transport system substrate-binding protein
VAALAAKDVSATIPIVFELGRDPVEIGLVSSLNHPGGNITGINMSTVALAQKRIELLAELLPEAKTITMLVNPASPTTKHEVAEADFAAHRLGRKLVMVAARDDRELDQAFAQIAEQQASALVAISSSLTPASAASRICARLSLRTGLLPPFRSALSSSRSYWVNITR